MSQIKWNLMPILAIAPAALLCDAAYATVYLTEQQAQKAIFGNAKMTKNFVTVSEEQGKEIAKRSGTNFRNSEIKIWNVEGGGVFIIDEVLGKHEFINYAVGINKDGTVKQIEIMQYNETYGYQVRDQSWRDQFIGKNSINAFKLDADIKNISGATLSCKHVSEGVRRVLITYELIKK